MTRLAMIQPVTRKRHSAKKKGRAPLEPAPSLDHGSRSRGAGWSGSSPPSLRRSFCGDRDLIRCAVLGAVVHHQLDDIVADQVRGNVAPTVSAFVSDASLPSGTETNAQL